MDASCRPPMSCADADEGVDSRDTIVGRLAAIAWSIAQLTSADSDLRACEALPPVGHMWCDTVQAA